MRGRKKAKEKTHDPWQFFFFIPLSSRASGSVGGLRLFFFGVPFNHESLPGGTGSFINHWITKNLRRKATHTHAHPHQHTHRHRKDIHAELVCVVKRVVVAAAATYLFH